MNVVCCSHDWRFKALPLSWYAFYFQAVFDETLHKLVDTYLRYAPRRYDIIKELPEEAKERHDEIHQLIFMTCLRMATFKESKVLFNQGQSVGHLTRKSGVLGSIPGLATYFRFSVRFFKKGSCQLLAKVCARSTG